MKGYNMMQVADNSRDFTAGGFQDTQTGKLISHMVKYMEKRNLSELTLGKLSMRINDELTEIKCNDSDIWRPVYQQFIDNSGHVIFTSGHGTKWYNYGNIIVARDANRHHVAVCREALYEYNIRECPICHELFFMHGNYSNCKLSLNAYPYGVSDDSNCVNGYNYITGEGRDTYYPLCPTCRDHYMNDPEYYTCERCGQILHSDESFYFEPDDMTYCESCYNDAEQEYERRREEEEEEAYMDEYDSEWHEQREINDYHGGNHRQLDLGDALMFGAEYEILCFDLYDDPDDRERFCDGLNRYGAITRDGSVDLEVVTTPMNLTDLRTNILSLASFCGEHHVRAWNGGKCGLHVHVNRGGISDIVKMYHFLRDNQEQLLTLSGRTDTYYCKFDFSATDNQLKSRQSGDRYVAVNLTNEKTVEFRFFRNTTNPIRLTAYFDFLDALFANNDQLDSMSWEDLIRKTNNQYLFEMFDVSRQLELPLMG